MLHAILPVLAVADQVAQNRIDLSPLIPVINGLITAFAGVLVVATPILSYQAVIWLRNHGIKMSAEAQGEIVKRVDDLVVKGQAFATQGADDLVENKLVVHVPDARTATVANYMIAQAPDLLAKAGADPRTVAGQQSLIRMVVARAIPTPPTPDSTLGVTITAAQPAPTAKEDKQ